MNLTLGKFSNKRNIILSFICCFIFIIKFFLAKSLAPYLYEPFDVTKYVGYLGMEGRKNGRSNIVKVRCGPNLQCKKSMEEFVLNIFTVLQITREKLY